MDLELDAWYEICNKATNLPTTNLQDFHIQFLNRAYLLNVEVSQFTNVSRSFSFCHGEDETHAFILAMSPGSGSL